MRELHGIWIEIPAKDVRRAAKFYEDIFGTRFVINEDDVRKAATPADHERGVVGVSLTETKNFEPGDKGPLPYIAAGEPGVDGVLSKVEAAGGKIITPKTDMGGGNGWYGMVQDTEGNVIAVHSMH